MSWHGIGLISGSWTPRFNPGIFQTPPPQVRPSQQWIGQPGTGFAAVPLDPARTTAKPACRLLTPPFQWFTDTLDVGVMAAANENASLANNLGIAHVIFHFEGGSAVIEEPTWRTILTRRGPRTYLGWWARLKRPLMKTGHGHLYVEAVPRDATMQTRVIGPFIFSPQSSAYDMQLTVEPSKAAITGQRYQTLSAAAQFARNQGAVNPLITITEPGLYQLIDGTPNAWSRNGYCNITSTVPAVQGMPRVWIGTSSEANPDVTMPDARMKLHIFGPNIGLDFRNMQQFSRGTGGVGFDHWLDGITITSTAPNGRDQLWRDGLRYATRIIQGRPFFTECDISEVLGPCNLANLVRGCNLRRTLDDAITEALCVVQSTFDDHNASFWNANTPLFTIRYDGPESVATLSRRGGVRGADTGNGVGMFRVTIGTTNHDRVVGDGTAPYWNRSLGDSYLFSEVVDWLNTLPGITAVLLDTVPRQANASGLGPADSSETPRGTVGRGWGFPGHATGPLDIKAQTRTVVSMWDLHGDWYQHAGGNLENVIVWGNRATNFLGQMVFLSPTGTAAARDVIFFGNGLHVIPTDGNQSQIGRDGTAYTASHVVIAHNSWARQSIRLRGNANNPAANVYNLIKNNAVQGISRSIAGNWPGLVIDGNHFPAGSAGPAGQTNSTFAGASSVEFYMNVDAGDFRPAAPLLDNMGAPAMRSDFNRLEWAEPGPVGALSG